MLFALYSAHCILCELLNFESCCGQTDIVTHRAAIAAKNVTKALLCGQLQTNKNFLGANFTSKMDYVLLTFKKK